MTTTYWVKFWCKGCQAWHNRYSPYADINVAYFSSLHDLGIGAIYVVVDDQYCEPPRPVR